MSTDFLYSVSSDTSAPKFPADKSKYINWKRKLEPFLNVRGLLKYIKEDQLKRSESENKSKSSSSNDEQQQKINEITKRENDRVYNILIQSLTDDQMILLNEIEEGNAFELFKKLNEFYGAVKTTDTLMSIDNNIVENNMTNNNIKKIYIYNGIKKKIIIISLKMRIRMCRL